LKESLLSLTRQSYRNSLQYPCVYLAKLAKGWTTKETTTEFAAIEGEIPTTAPSITHCQPYERLWLYAVDRVVLLSPRSLLTWRLQDDRSLWSDPMLHRDC